MWFCQLKQVAMASDIMAWIPKKFRKKYRSCCAEYNCNKLAEDGKKVVESLNDYYNINRGNIFMEIMADERLRALTCSLYADVAMFDVIKEWKLRAVYIWTHGLHSSSVPVEYSMVSVL